MGFQPQLIENALMKHSNDLNKAIDELTMIKNLDDITHNERMVPNEFTTTVQLLNSIYRKKFTIRDNGGLGDCLFFSLHETLTRVDPSITRHKTHHDIRLEIVNYVMKHLKRPAFNGLTFEDAIEDGGVVVNGQTLYMGNYEDEMRKQGTYGTEIEISAAAQLYELNIYVVNRNGISFDQLHIGTGTPNWQNTWYIFNYNYTHYTSLLCDDAPGGYPH